MTAVVLVTVLVFARVLGHDFVMPDDDVNIFANARFLPPTWTSIAAFWRQPYYGLYIPVTYTEWGAIAALFSSGSTPIPPAPFHAANLVLHAANARLVFGLLVQVIERDFARRLPAGFTFTPTRHHVAAAIGALAFSLHPVQAEPVSWVTGFKDVGSGFFALLALSNYYTSLESGRPGRHYAVATVAFMLALLSKPVTMVIIPFALLLELSARGRFTRKTAARLVPWLVAAAILALATIGQESSATQSAVRLRDRPLVALDALGFYLSKVAWPARLTVEYGRTPDLVLRDHWHLLAWATAAGLGLFVAVFRRNRPLLLALGIFVVGVLPVLGLVQFLFQVYSSVADRYLYLSMLGLGLAFAWAGLRAPRAVVGAAIVVIAAWGVTSSMQTRHWKNLGTLVAQMLAVDPENAIGLGATAELILEEKRDSATALALLVKVRPKMNGFTLAWFNLDVGLAHTLAGDLPAAEAAYRTGLRVDSDNIALANGPLHNDLAIILDRLGHRTEALSELDAALAASPDLAEAHYNLARLAACSGHGRDPAVAQHLRRAVQTRPEFVRAVALQAALSQDGDASCPTPALAWSLPPPFISWDAWRAIERDGL